MRLLFGRCSSTKFQISLISQTRYSAHVPIEFQLKMSETPKSEQTASGVRAARKVCMQKCIHLLGKWTNKSQSLVGLNGSEMFK